MNTGTDCFSRRLNGKKIANDSGDVLTSNPTSGDVNDCTVVPESILCGGLPRPRKGASREVKVEREANAKMMFFGDEERTKGTVAARRWGKPCCHRGLDCRFGALLFLYQLHHRSEP